MMLLPPHLSFLFHAAHPRAHASSWVKTPLRWLFAAAIPVLGGLPDRAKADENMFGYTYGADTLPAGHFEFYNWTTWRHSKGVGEYDAFDIQFELEYGITDRFQTSTYLMIDARDTNVPSDDYNNGSQLGFDGVKQAFKYNFLSTYKDPVGFSLYLEPGYSRFHKVTGERIDEFELETKIILQKNFLDNTLIWALNITPEFEWYFPNGEPTEKEFIVEATTGLSYRFAKNWSVGIEGRYHTEFPDYGEQEHQAFFLGPNIHYGAEKWWFTITWLPQIWGEPKGFEHEHGDGGHESHGSSHLHLGEHEKMELRVKVGFNF